MKAEYTSEGWRDFNQRYAGTFGWFERIEKPPLLVKLNAVHEFTLDFQDENGHTFTAVSNKGNSFSFLPVVKGCYVCDDNIVIVQRIPARQYKRGICTENTSIQDVMGFNRPVDFPILKSIFTNPVENTIDIWKANPLAGQVLLNRQFYIAGSGVYLYHNKIGTYKLGSITLESSLFQQELQDLMVKHGLNVEIVCQ